MALIARPFEDGEGPSHGTLELIWAAADAGAYLPVEGNKVHRVLEGLSALQRGAPAAGLAPDERKLCQVVADLASRLMASGVLDGDRIEAALARDGFVMSEGELNVAAPLDAPTDRLASHLDDLFDAHRGSEIARNHYAQARRAFDRGDWEAANAQFRSACDAVFDSLAQARGCPDSKTGGAARKWLQEQQSIEPDEGTLIQAFMAFAGRAGSHAGLSGAADSQLRRHFATALMVFAYVKLGDSSSAEPE